MQSVADYLNPEALEILAKPAARKHGAEIAEHHGVELVEFGPLKVVVKVQPTSGQKRTVEFFSSTNGLVWKCTCMKETDRFCRHAVAAAMVTWQQSPNRKSYR